MTRMDASYHPLPAEHGLESPAKAPAASSQDEAVIEGPAEERLTDCSPADDSLHGGKCCGGENGIHGIMSFNRSEESDLFIREENSGDKVEDPELNAGKTEGGEVGGGGEEGERREKLFAEPRGEQLELDELRWGWCAWHPECLQRFNSARWLLVIMSAVVLFQGMIISGLIGSSATSIERRFQLRSQDYGVLVSVYEATTILFILLVTFVGGHGHKPRCIAIGCVIVALGSLLFSLPHFITDVYDNFHDGDGDAGICEHEHEHGVDLHDEVGCMDEEQGEKLSPYLYVFGAAQVLLALGSLPIYTLGIAVLDESVTERNSGVYLGILYALSAFGPALGYVVAGISLTVFTDIHLPEGSDVTDDDPQWVGAWWIGFVLAGVCMLTIALPLAAFPRELPTTAKIRAEKECQAHVNSRAEITARPNFGATPGDLVRVIQCLLVNPTFMCTTLAGCSDTLLITAFGVFLPKFIENQFTTTATVATMIVGICVVPGGAGGMMLGGWLLRRLRLRVSGMLKLCIAMTIVTTLAVPSMFLRCPQNTVVGMLASYEPDPLSSGTHLLPEPNLTHQCNQACRCSAHHYAPVCLEDLRLEFFSPCHAGCTEDFDNGTYTDCSCAGHVTGGIVTSLQAGRCSSECVSLPIFVTLLTFLLTVLFVPMVPALNVTLRSVPETQRSMALGVQSVIGRCLGSIPGPIFFGVIIDSTCLQWQETCNDGGSCWLYHNDSLAWRLVVLTSSMKIFSGFMFVAAWWTYRPATSHKEDDAQGKDDTQI